MIVANENHGRKLFITGEGKSGTVGQRMAASLTSLGISSQFVPAIEWAHGDLGHLSEGDCVFLISHSGKNKDVISTGFGCVLGSLLYTVLWPGRGKRQDCDRAE